MFRALAQFNDYISLAVMLLMLVALLGGRPSAGEYLAPEPFYVAVSLPFSAELEGQIGVQAVKVGIAAAASIGGPGHFRGQDE